MNKIPGTKRKKKKIECIIIINIFISGQPIWITFGYERSLWLVMNDPIHKSWNIVQCTLCSLWNTYSLYEAAQKFAMLLEKTLNLIRSNRLPTIKGIRLFVSNYNHIRFDSYSIIRCKVQTVEILNENKMFDSN